MWPSIILRLLGLRAKLSDLVSWITESTARMLSIVIAVLIITIMWQQHRISDRDDAIAEWKRAVDGWKQAAATTRASYLRLHDAVQDQNHAVEQLKAEADKRVAAGQAALRDAVDRSATREGLAARIEAQRPSGGDCRTSAGVMAAKEEL